MLKRFVQTTAVAAAMITFGDVTPADASVAKPPANFQGQWWTHPSGCEYSRAGRPGETIWFLIVNTAKPGCPTYIATRTWGNIYEAEAPRIPD